MKAGTVLTAAGILAMLAADAGALGGTAWTRCRGREKASLKERKKAARAARRAALNRAFADGFLSVDPSGDGLDLSAPTLGAGYHSPCRVNARNTAAATKVDIPDASSPGLTPELQTHVQDFQSYLAGQFQPGDAAKPTPLSFTGVTLKSLKIRGSWRPIRNFTKLVGSETVTFRAVLVGGDSDGVEISGSYRVVLSGADRST